MKQISKKEAFSHGLPKWPQMLVVGDPVTEEQAKEIIFATDTFLTRVSGFYGGNDRHWEDAFMEASGYRLLNSESWAERRVELQHRFGQKAGFLHTEYVHNSWASSAFVLGPNGWCHPDGNIFYTENVGKWPCVEEIAEDWAKIAARWPFLDIWVTLMNGESCQEAEPVVSMHVKAGKVEFYAGSTEVYEERKGQYPDHYFNRPYVIGNLQKEHGLPQSWIEEFANKVRPVVLEVLEVLEATQESDRT